MSCPPTRPSSGQSRNASVPTVSSTPVGPASARGPMARSPRQSPPPAAPTSRSWSWATGPACPRMPRVGGPGIDRSQLATSGDTVNVRVDVTNTGSRPGDEVVQLYLRDEEATVARPILELRGFRRLHLAAGECRTVTLRVSTEQLAHIDVDHRRDVAPGANPVHPRPASVEL